MTIPTFEDFLKEQHAEDYHGTDDDMPDAFDDWVGELDAQGVFDYAEEYGKGIFETYSPKKLAVHSGSTTTQFTAELVPNLEQEMELMADQESKHGEERVSANDH